MSTININVSKADMGLDQVDNTSDLNKPISTATQTALNNKVDKVTGSRLITSAEATLLGNTSGTNTGDQNLQSVTNNGYTTTTNLVSQSDIYRNILSPSTTVVGLLDLSRYSVLDGDGKIQLKTNATATGLLKATNVTAETTLEFPNKTAGSYTIATTTDFSGTNTGDQTLQQVTTVGNTTTDNIAFTGAVGVLFDNTSTLRKGTIDAGYGGAKGIAQICSVGYELKWEAGRLYVMGDGGTTIREVSHNFTTTPSATDDNTKGFIVGSRWILDNGDLYVCTDVTTATAVWVLQTIDASPTDGSTKAVSSNGVFDALALKSNIANPIFTGLTTLDTLKVTTGNYITPVDIVGIDAVGNVNRVSASNGRTALGLGTLATQNGTFSGTSSGTNTGDQTFLNARVQTVTSSATVTPVSTNDLVIITAQAVGLTLANPTGTFTEGQALMIRIKDNGTARTIAFDTNYRAIGVTLPTTTVISKTLYLGIIYNSTDAKWDIIGYNIQA